MKQNLSEKTDYLIMRLKFTRIKQTEIRTPPKKKKRKKEEERDSTFSWIIFIYDIVSRNQR